MIDVAHNEHAMRTFMLGMYGMLCLVKGVRYVGKTHNSITPDACIAYRLTYICLLLLFVLIVISLGLTDFMAQNYNPWTWNIIEHLMTLSDLMVVPFAGLLLIHLTHAYEVNLKRSLVHTCPFILLFIYYFFTYDEKVFQLSYFLSIFYAAVIYLLTMSRVYFYQKTLKSTYEDPSSRSLKWVYWFVNMLLLQNISYHLVPETLNSDIPRTIYYVLSIANWWMATEMLDRQVLDVEDMKEKLRLGMRFSREEQPEEEMNPIDRELSRLCSEESIYLDPDLSCEKLAKAVGTNRTYMSIWFREHGTNFNDYINGLRLKHAEFLLRTTSDNILTVGSKSGFNHPNTFRNVFKELYGCTPKEYRKQLEEDESK